ncbi:hypothetical protein [Proteiniphilum acetatigenes]|uniref:hypothetical protein n=1 Tax=Proteiniphilum acetatigenes TaxID=294710 RepID=UPI00036D567F|nr:hypothetical protein [Proteiniphilum acetatigenes]SFK99264.1 hypothetical protein SAMN05216357_11050 [Porphyromonadaceae bacterium KH3CP3RA]
MEATNKIQKAKIKDYKLEAAYEEYFSEENYSNIIEKKCAQIAHGDLQAALDKLKVHLACICEMPEAEAIKEFGVYDYPLSKLDGYVVTGYTHGGSDESAGVTIIGKKLLKSGKVLNLISPFIQYEDTDAYPFAGELYADIEACDYEVEQYLFHEKFGIKQMSLDFDAPDEADISAEPQKPKKRGRKKKEIEVKAFDPTA